MGGLHALYFVVMTFAFAFGKKGKFRLGPQQVDPACDLCSVYNWTFIIGTGRSGSTTILEMANLIEGVSLAGENFGQVNYLQEMHDKAVHTASMGQGPAPAHGPWKHGHINTARLLCDHQQYLMHIMGKSSANSAEDQQLSMVGFKEIRHLDTTTLDFFKVLFPCARYIVNIRRNVAQQHKSGFQKKKSTEVLQHSNAVLESWAQHNKERCFFLPLEDFSLESFNTLFHWLTWDQHAGCAYTSVIHANANGSYTTSVTHAEIRCDVNSTSSW
jgi:hypothetical protein